MYKLGAILLGSLCGAIIAVILATTSSAAGSVVPQISATCVAIEGVPHRVVQSRDAWLQASIAATNAPPEWINLTLVRTFRELPNDACK